MWRLMSLTLAAILGLGVAGNVMEPSWSPATYTAPAEFSAVEYPPPVAPQPLHERLVLDQVAIQVEDDVVGGLVYTPAQPGRYPGLVFIHGAGTNDRTGFAEQAEHLARSGVVALVMDKRTADYSPWHRNFEGMAVDVLAGVELLRNRADVDPATVGLFAESEGTWVAPVAATQDPDIAFTIMVSAPVVAPAQQATYATLMAFSNLDVPAPVNRAVAKGIGTALSLPSVLDYAKFDILPWLAEATQPMLMAYGTEDPAIPVVQAAELARSAAGGEVTVRYFDGAQHAIRIGDTAGPFAPGYLAMLAVWIGQVAENGAAVGPDIAGGQPVQTLSAEAAPNPPWYATAYAHLTVLGIALAGYLAGPVVAAVSRLRPGRAGALRMSRARRRSLRWVRVSGLASVVSLVAYFVGLSHLALNQLANPLMIYGVWAVVWIITAGAVVALVNLWSSDTWRAHPVAVAGADRFPTASVVAAGEGEAVADSAVPRYSLVEAVALGGAAAGTVLLLLVVTYWGVFLGI